jgi:uncharacterized protein
MVPVAELLGGPGRYRDISVSEPIGEVGTALARLDSGPVDATLRAESVVEGILVTGRVRADASARCARCLTDLPMEVEVNVCELFAAPDATDVEDDAYRVTGTEIDLEPMLRDALALGLPLNPLCSRDCKGLCAGCGTDLNAADCVCSTESSDPRWAPLEALRDRLESQQA